MNETKNFINSIDWPLVSRITAKMLAVAAFVWAVLKLILIAKTYGTVVAVIFAGMHLPFCLFGMLFVLWFFDSHQQLGFLALASDLLNAVLI